jgi:hypothetical protein
MCLPHRGEIDMHPFNYDITVRTQKLEIERAQRKFPPYKEFMHVTEEQKTGPRRIDVLIGRLTGLLSPARTRKAFAD